MRMHCRVSGALSLNAAMFAAVLLASRLPTTIDVFVFVVLAIQLFALFPIVRDFIRVRSERAHLALTATLVGLTLALLLLNSTLLAIVYAAGVAFMVFVCPYWLMSVQKYKNEIQGPWDIATVAQFST
jgi:phosphatidylinositol glycan class C protein